MRQIEPLLSNKPVRFQTRLDWHPPSLCAASEKLKRSSAFECVGNRRTRMSASPPDRSSFVGCRSSAHPLEL
jgi:hypothetical protein